MGDRLVAVAGTFLVMAFIWLGPTGYLCRAIAQGPTSANQGSSPKGKTQPIAKGKQTFQSTTHPGQALTRAIELQRRGEFESAGYLLRHAYNQRNKLSRTEKIELARVIEQNNVARKARALGRKYLRLAEKAYEGGRYAEASQLHRQLAVHDQYLNQKDKQRSLQLGQRLKSHQSPTLIRRTSFRPSSGSASGGTGVAPKLVGQTINKPRTARSPTPEGKSNPHQVLGQARVALQQGKLQLAEKLANRARTSQVRWSRYEDTPDKVLADLKKARKDPKVLLSAARRSLKSGDLDQAELYAKQAEQESSMWTFPLWGDSPSKVLVEIKAARKSREPKAEVRKVSKGRHISTPQVLKASPKDKAASGQPSQSTGQAQARGTRKKSGAPQFIRGGSEDARALVRQGRAQLAAGKLDEALKTAQRAKALGETRWGLFADTPDKLIADLRKAMTRRDQQQSVKVLAEARKLYEKGDLDGAEKKAHKAAQLHGPYGIWDFGDRPATLLSKIEADRARGRTTKLPPPVESPGQSEPKSELVAARKPAAVKSSPSPSAKIAKAPKRKPSVNGTQSGGRGTNGATPKAAQARQLVKEARTLQKQGKLLDARQKALAAQALKVPFGPGEETPEKVLQELAVQAHRGVNRLIQYAHHEAMYGKGEPARRYQTAEKMLRRAHTLAHHFRQDVVPVQAKLTWLQGLKQRSGLVQASRGFPVHKASSGITPAAPFSAPKSDSKSAPVKTVVKTHPPVTNTTQPTGTQGQKLLAQARTELRKGETGTAKRLVLEACKPQYGVRAKAIQLLRSVETEEFYQKSLRTARMFDAAHRAYLRHDYHHARNLLGTINPRLLDPRRRSKLNEVLGTPEMQPQNVVASEPGNTTPEKIEQTPKGQDPAPVVAKGASPEEPASGTGVVRTGGKVPEGTPSRVAYQSSAPGRARATDEKDPASALVDRTRALREVLFQKHREDGLEVQRQAARKFRTGQTDDALDILQDYLARLGEVDLQPSQIALLRRPVEARLNRYRLLKAQQDLRTESAVALKARKSAVGKRQLAKIKKQENVTKLMKEFNTLYRQSKYDEAMSLALHARELDPDNAIVTTAIHMTRTQIRRNAYRKLAGAKEELNYHALNDAEDTGDALPIKTGVSYDAERWARAKKRKPLGAIRSLRKAEKEREIESKLTQPVNLNFANTPLRDVIADLRAYTGINFFIDTTALLEDGISLDQPVTVKLEQISLKSALKLLLSTVNLTYVIKDEVLQITTEGRALGKLAMITYQVADLVIPIQNFGDVQNPQAPALLGTDVTPQPGSQPTPISGPNGLPPGAPVGSPTGSASDNSSLFGSSPGTGGSGVSVQKSSGDTLEESLISLITRTVAPNSWSSMGGAGTIDYFPPTMSLVINQSADIQEQIQDLLAALRRLQDQEVAIEVRFITINENFFERIGVKFSANILTDDITDRFEPAITSGNFKPAGWINQFSPDRFLAGITPAGTFTNTLDIPINVQTFEQAIPPFGGYPGVPGFGGLTLGIGFLSDIQVFLFMEAVQGDTRSNIMQAPKLTMFNGQTASLNVTDPQFFVTNVQVLTQQGQFIFFPQVQQFVPGVNLTLQPVISADRRFVRLSIGTQLTNLATNIVPLFPVVIPIFPLVSGVQTGQPIVFTQYIQQPVFTQVGVQTTVAVPDGGTVLLGGLKRLSEGRNEFGPPVLAKIPYVNRLFKNVGYGREAASLLMMVTPRIIIQEEEEERQTGVTRPPQVQF